MSRSMPFIRTLGVAIVVLCSTRAWAANYALPFVLESKGNTDSRKHVFDYTLHARYLGGRAGIPDGGGGQIDLFLYQQDGQPLRGNDRDVCSPCSFLMSSATPSRDILLEDLILAAGGFTEPEARGFAVIGVGGPDPVNIDVVASLANSHTRPDDRSTLELQPTPVDIAHANVSLLPRVRQSARGPRRRFGYDQVIYALYAGGRGSIADAGGGTLDVYLYAPDGAPLQGRTNAVCNPCSFSLSSAQPHVAASIDSLVLAAGGFPTPQLEGFAVVIAGGADPSNIALTSLISNLHHGPRDVDVSISAPQPHTP